MAMETVVRRVLDNTLHITAFHELCDYVGAGLGDGIQCVGPFGCAQDSLDEGEGDLAVEGGVVG